MTALSFSGSIVELTCEQKQSSASTQALEPVAAQGLAHWQRTKKQAYLRRKGKTDERQKARRLQRHVCSTGHVNDINFAADEVVR